MNVIQHLSSILLQTFANVRFQVKKLMFKDYATHAKMLLVTVLIHISSTQLVANANAVPSLLLTATNNALAASI